MMSTVIEVKAFGDFDVMYTYCIMVHSDTLNRDELMSEFYTIRGISSNRGLCYRDLYGITEDFVAFLEMKGFVRLQTQVVYFCD
jgi:hypothetical protein